MDQMNSYVFADESGAILQVYRTTQVILPCDDTTDDLKHYVDGGMIREKHLYQPEHMSDGLEVMIEQLPANTLVESNGASVMSDGGSLSINYDIPGTYTITLSGRVDYLDTEFEVIIDDA